MDSTGTTRFEPLCTSHPIGGKILCMHWRKALYGAFPNAFGWKMRPLLPEDLQELHEYAVFLRSRLIFLAPPEQVNELGFVMENLMDTCEWDSRGTEQFLDWLNPFNDYRGAFIDHRGNLHRPREEDTTDVLKWAEELAQRSFLRPLWEEQMQSLINRLHRLPRIADGRMELFSALDELQRLAVWLWLEAFEKRYGKKLNWVARLNLRMAKLYWCQVTPVDKLHSLEQVCRERLRTMPWVSQPSPWKQVRKLAEGEVNAPYFTWMVAEEWFGAVVEVATAPNASAEERRHLTDSLSSALWTPETPSRLLHGWVRLWRDMPDCLSTYRGLMLHSPRLRQRIESLGVSSAVRYTPILLREKDSGCEAGVYYAVFFLVSLECLSRTRTIGLWNDDFTRVIDLHYPVLVASRIGGVELFTIGEWQPLTWVVVSRRVRDAIVEAGTTGCVFRAVKVVEE